MHVFCRFLAEIFRKSSFLTREYIFVITTKGINVNNPKKNRELGNRWDIQEMDNLLSTGPAP